MTTAETFEIVIDQPPGRKLPKWQKTAFVQDGTVYVPAMTGCGKEQMTFLCASFDGEPVHMLDGHPFLRLAWVEQEYPDPRWDSIERPILELAEGF